MDDTILQLHGISPLAAGPAPYPDRCFRQIEDWRWKPPERRPGPISGSSAKRTSGTNLDADDLMICALAPLESFPWMTAATGVPTYAIGPGANVITFDPVRLHSGTPQFTAEASATAAPTIARAIVQAIEWILPLQRMDRHEVCRLLATEFARLGGENVLGPQTGGAVTRERLGDTAGWDEGGETDAVARSYLAMQRSFPAPSQVALSDPYPDPDAGLL